MSDRPEDRARAAGGPLWFLAERDALLRRFVLRTLLEPPRARRGLHPFSSPRPHPIPSPRLHPIPSARPHPIPSPRPRGEG
jgi:hypothetical protein